MTAQPTLNENLDWNWGVPDWRDEKAYFTTHNLTDRQWRWEFKRRRQSYREVWVRWYWMVREEAESIKPFLRRGPGWSKDEELETIGPWHGGLERMNDGNTDTIKDPSRQFCDWQLESAVGYRDFIERRRPPKRPRPPSISAKDWRLYGSGFWQFDLTKPLPAQFAIAMSTITKYQNYLYGKQNKLKPKRDLWPLYLRALDAKDAGATYDLMAKTFWPNDFDKKTPQSARDVYQAAVTLRNNFPF